MIDRIMSISILGNSIIDYGMALAMSVGGIIVIKIFHLVVLGRVRKWAQRTETPLDDILIRGIEKSLIPLLYFGAVYLSLVNAIKFPARAGEIIHGVFLAAATIFAVRIISSTMRHSIRKYWERKTAERGDGDTKSLQGISSFINFILWTLGVIFFMDNMGFEISAVVTGLGIGGIAVALAAQTILGDLFNYFVIIFDQPFKAGDFIVVDGKMGVVEKIGIKTTRITSISGEQIILSNTDLTKSRIHNYKQMERRRIEFGFGVEYSTDPEKLERIPAMVREIIEGIDGAEFDRAHFKNFGDSSLDIVVVYYVKTSDYISYMDIQQEINLAIFRKMKNEGVSFAFPSRTVYLQQNS